MRIYTYFNFATNIGYPYNQYNNGTNYQQQYGYNNGNNYQQQYGYNNQPMYTSQPVNNTPTNTNSTSDPYAWSNIAGKSPLESYDLIMKKLDMDIKQAKDDNKARIARDKKLGLFKKRKVQDANTVIDQLKALNQDNQSKVDQVKAWNQDNKNKVDTLAQYMDNLNRSLGITTTLATNPSEPKPTAKGNFFTRLFKRK